MSWAGISSNQTVSFANLLDAVNKNLITENNIQRYVCAIKSCKECLDEKWPLEMEYDS